MSNFFSENTNFKYYFEEYQGGNKANNTGYTNETKDLSELYKPYDGISLKTIEIGYSVNNIDLNEIFQRNPRYIFTDTILTQNNLDDFEWPVTLINNSDTYLKIIFDENLTFDSLNYFFIIGSNNIIIEGNYKKIIINTNQYNGLVKNGDLSIFAYSNIILNNIRIYNNTINYIQNNNGWITQEYFGRGLNFLNNYCFINNCEIDENSSSNNINNGLVCGSFTTNTICNYCSSEGHITGGGIFGTYALNCIANNCFSTGNIGNDQSTLLFGSGGIFASLSISCKSNNCYSLGNIYYNSGYGSGGIGGEQSDIQVNNSYSKGIIGNNSSTFNSTIYGCGGIFGWFIDNSSIAINCYTNGIIETYSDGIGYNANYSNSYITNGLWSDTTANANLLETPTSTEPYGNIWTNYNLSNNMPFNLTSNLNKYYTSSQNDIYNLIIGFQETINYNNELSIFENNIYLLKINSNKTIESSSTINGYVSFIFTSENSDYGYNNMSVYDNNNNLLASNLIIRINN